MAKGPNVAIRRVTYMKYESITYRCTMCLRESGSVKCWATASFLSHGLDRFRTTVRPSDMEPIVVAMADNE